jgi:hypothetical protein
MTDNHRFMGIAALTCRVTIRFGRDLRKLLILCPLRPSVQILLPFLGLRKFHGQELTVLLCPDLVKIAGDGVVAGRERFFQLVGGAQIVFEGTTGNGSLGGFIPVEMVFDGTEVFREIQPGGGEPGKIGRQGFGALHFGK